jgi:hypothetical protein
MGGTSRPIDNWLCSTAGSFVDVDGDAAARTPTPM